MALCYDLPAMKIPTRHGCPSMAAFVSSDRSTDACVFSAGCISKSKLAASSSGSYTRLRLSSFQPPVSPFVILYILLIVCRCHGVTADALMRLGTPPLLCPNTLMLASTTSSPALELSAQLRMDRPIVSAFEDTNAFVTSYIDTPF